MIKVMRLFSNYFIGNRYCDHNNRQDFNNIIYKQINKRFTVKKLKEIIKDLPDDYDVRIGTHGVTIEVEEIIPMEEVNILKIECKPEDFVEMSEYVVLDTDIDNKIKPARHRVKIQAHNLWLG